MKEMINLNGVKLKNKFVVASGALGYGLGYPWQKALIAVGVINLAAFGAITTKTLTLEPRSGQYVDPLTFEGNWLHPRQWRKLLEAWRKRKRVLIKTAGGWLNNTGWWNVGIDYFVENIHPKLKRKNINSIVSIGGWTIEHYTQLIHRLNGLDLTAIELNISCPNVSNPWSDNPTELIKLFSFCRAVSAHPLIVKLGPDKDFVAAARYAQYCGINAIAAVNTQPAASIESRKSQIFCSGLSGKPLKPIALRIIYELRKADITLPIIGGGGIYSWADCREFFLAGADAVSFGSVFLEKPWLPSHIIKKHKARAF